MRTKKSEGSETTKKELHFNVRHKTREGMHPIFIFQMMLLFFQVAFEMEEQGFTDYVPSTPRIPFQSNKKFHVFLSFRGKDVRKTLVDHLYEALSAAGIHVFLDSLKLKKGELIDLSLETAIQSSSIRIPIFSKGYASSVWCLREATLMLSSPGLIIPLFYDVEPAQVRFPEKDFSPYAEAFKKHYGHLDRYPKEDIEKWKDALQQISSRSGWSMESTAGFEGQLVKKVASDVINTLDNVPLDVAKHPVGLNNLKATLIQNLKLDEVNTVVRVGILGISGIGKTTVAKAVYNEIYPNFDKCSFVFNVGSTAEKISGLPELQRIILKDLADYREDVRSVEHGKSLMRDRLRRVHAFVILDDVNSCAQLEALAGDWMAPGSRLIITSRDRHILNVAQVSLELIHEMSGLKKNEALQLFCWHAFQRTSPDDEYEDVSKRIVEACHTHPLSLEVVGTFLSDKRNSSDFECWKETANNIASHEEIFKTFNISYDALGVEEKEIFLDIACFFIGENIRDPILFWGSLYNNVSTAINNLKMKLFIKINDKGAFDMHPHLKDMGRKIAEKESNPTRLWKATSDVTSLFNNMSSQHTNVSRLSLLFPNRGSNMQNVKFRHAPSLRYLHLDATRIELAPNLIWLRLDHSSFVSEMDDLALCKCSYLSKRRPELTFVGNNFQLKFMHLRYCISLQGLPNTIGKLLELQSLDLSNCWGLRTLPNTIGNLSKLRSLVLSNCFSLKTLPNTIGKLSQLQALDLRMCNKLKNLPKTIGNLSQLQSLDLYECVNLKNLSNTLHNLSQLQSLKLSGSGLQNLDNTIGSLEQLQFLEMSNYKNLEALPFNIGKLSQLRYLKLDGWSKLQSLPATISNLSHLQSLKISGSGLQYLDNTIGSLTQLQSLELSNCRNLEALPFTIGNLSQLKSLKLDGCTKVESLPTTISNLSHLQSLKLSGSGLQNLENTIGSLEQLQSLELSNCENLKAIPFTMGNLSQLKSLKLDGCSKLQSLPTTISTLSHMAELDLRRCCGLEGFPDISAIIPAQLKMYHLSSPAGYCMYYNTKSNSNTPSSAGNVSELGI